VRLEVFVRSAFITNTPPLIVELYADSESVNCRTLIGGDYPAPERLRKLAWVPAFAGMTVSVRARHPPTTVIPAKAGIHASFSGRK